MEIAAVPMLADVSWGWIALLLAAGVIMAVAEIFIPSGGLLTVVSVLSFLGAVVMAFFVGSTAGIITLLAVILLTPLLIYVLMRIWPHTPIAKRIILGGPASRGTAGDLTRREPGALVGRTGVAKTLLRPAGKMTLDGQTIDCVTEGEYVQPGTRVTVLEEHGARVVVRPVPEENEEASPPGDAPRDA